MESINIDGNETLFAMIFGIIVTYFMVALVIGIIVYVFSSIGLYKMAKQKGINNAWLSWIPTIKLYIVGMLINKKVSFKAFVVPYAQIIFPVLTIATYCLLDIKYLGEVLAIVGSIYYCVAMYRLYKLYQPRWAGLFTVLSIFLPVEAFFIFGMRNNDPVEYLETSNLE